METVKKVETVSSNSRERKKLEFFFSFTTMLEKDRKIIKQFRFNLFEELFISNKAFLDKQLSLPQYLHITATKLWFLASTLDYFKT